MALGAFTVVGSTLNAQIIDDNFDLLRQYLQEQVLSTEINLAQITRWVLRRNSGGMIKSATLNANHVIDQFDGKKQSSNSYHEVTFNNSDSNVGDMLDTPPVIKQSKFTMEYLGRPGPSFYWDWQEDAQTYVGSTSPGKYDDDYCYSYWLTVPKCSLKLYVPHGCAVKMHGRAYFLGNMTAVSEYYVNGPDGSVTLNKAAFEFAGGQELHGRQTSMKMGLFVDTNPNLYSDEFTNSNPNVVDPVSGSQAGFCSWQEVSTKTVHAPMWQREDITGATILKGGRWYNFSMKYRGAGWVGYEDASSFVDGVYEYDIALAGYVGHHLPMIGTPPFEVQWVSTSLHLEFFYGYSALYSDSSLIGNMP